MGEIANKKMTMKNGFRIFGGSFFHPLPEIRTKHNIKETASKDNIWGPFYILKGEVLGGSKIIRKYYVTKNIYLDHNLNNFSKNV